MKIAIIANSSSGLYNFRKELIKKLSEYGFVVVAITAIDGRENQLIDLGIEIVRIDIDRRGVNPFHDFSYINKLKSILKRVSPDYVVTYTIKPNVYAGLICRNKGLPYSANITGLGSAFNKSGLLKRIAIILNKSALKKARCVFFENSDNLSFFVNNSIIRENQAVLLNGAGVNLDYFSYKKYPQNGIFRFLFIGRIMKEKGIDELFEAMKRLMKENYKCVLEILGGYDEKYHEIIKQYENDGWLVYSGYQKDVRPYIEKANCFVLPSYHEGMANTNLESAATGRPIITSDIPGCKEAVIDGVSGFLCQPGDADSLYDAMKKMILKQNVDREAMGVEGRRHMEKVFDKNAVIDKTIKSMKIV